MIIKLVDKGWSYKKVAEKVGLKAKSTVAEIYRRDKDKYTRS